MSGIHTGAACGGGLGELPQQIGVVLTGEAGAQPQHIALAEWTMTGPALLQVNARSLVDISAVAGAFGRGWKARQTRRVRGDVGQILWERKMMLIGKMLHPFVPAAVVSKVDELLEQHGAMLASDRRNISVIRAAPSLSVTRRAGLEQLCASLNIRSEVRRFQEFLSCSTAGIVRR